MATDSASSFEIDMDYPQSLWDEEERVIIEQGRNKSFTCRVSNIQFFDVVRVKLVQGNKTLIISDNGDLKEPFLLLRRYEIHFDFVQDTAIVTLGYNGILGEDSGTLSCQKLSSSSTALLEVIVLVPPTKIEMYRIQQNATTYEMIEQPIQHGGVIDINDNEAQGIRCSASVVSSSRAPWLKMRIDGVDQDIQAVDKVIILPSTTPSPSTTPVLQELTRYESTATITHTLVKPNSTHHGRVVSCTSRTDKIFEPLRISATISVRFKPVIICPVTSYEARNGDNVTMVCDLESNPESRIKWSIGSKDKPLQHDKYFSFYSQPLETKEKSSSSSSSSSSLPMSSTSSSSSSSFSPSSMTTTKRQVTMTITRIKESHFGAYSVTASNDLGKSQADLTLSKMAAGHVPQPTNHKQADRPSKQPHSSKTLHRAKGYFRSSSGKAKGNWSPMMCYLSLFVTMVTTRLTSSWLRSSSS